MRKTELLDKYARMETAAYCWPGCWTSGSGPSSGAFPPTPAFSPAEQAVSADLLMAAARDRGF